MTPLMIYLGRDFLIIEKNCLTEEEKSSRELDATSRKTRGWHDRLLVLGPLLTLHLCKGLSAKSLEAYNLYFEDAKKQIKLLILFELLPSHLHHHGAQFQSHTHLSDVIHLMAK